MYWIGSCGALIPKIRELGEKENNIVGSAAVEALVALRVDRALQLSNTHSAT